MRTILVEGRNCWRIVPASRVAFLVDGAQYFAAFAESAARAERAIMVAGWDMDSRIRLFRDGLPRELPEELGRFLNALVARRRGLRAHLLEWDFNVIFALEREPLPVLSWEWRTHRRVQFRLDGIHPPLGSHHQKLAVFDDAVAYAGGLDLARSRWDTPEHRVPDPRRVNAAGDAYPPYHDVMMAVSGEAAAALGELFRERWRRATGRELRGAWRVRGDPWPPWLEPDLAEVPVAIARTMPAHEGRPEVREVETLLLDAVAAAERLVFIENQYLTAASVESALAARLREPGGPEVVIILPRESRGGFEEKTMGVLRSRVLKQLREVDRFGRLGVYYPVPDGDPEGTVNVHSKVLAVDDDLVRVGSSNLTNRSMGLDTECDLAIEAAGSGPVREAVARLRWRLVGEHLGVAPEKVADAEKEHGSLIAAIDGLRGPGRTLAPLDWRVPGWQERLLPGTELVDLGKPVAPGEIIGDIVPEGARKSTRHGIYRGVALVLILFAAGAAWAFTPLRHWASPDALSGWAGRVAAIPLAPLIVIAAFVAGGLVVMPVNLLVAATAFAFGPIRGIVYSLLGALAGAVVTYGLGRVLGGRAICHFAGRRLSRLARLIRRRGLVAMATARLVPVAPFTIVNVIAGAFRVRFAHFALGTLVGMTPGIVALSVFGHRLERAIRNPGWMSFAVLSAVVAALVLLAAWTGRALSRREERLAADEARASREASGSGDEGMAA